MTKRSGPLRSASAGGGSGVASKVRLAAYSSSGVDPGAEGRFTHADANRNERFFLQGVGGPLLSGEDAGGRHAALLRGALPDGRDQQHLLPDAGHIVARARGAALCVMEDDDGETSPFVVTSEDAYLRLRRTQYTEDDLRAWADRIAAQPLERAWVYFKHEDEASAPRFAQRLAEVWPR